MASTIAITPASLSAQTPSPAPVSEVTAGVRTVPMAPPVPQGRERGPTYTGDSAIDIPQWAKDAGHNGRAIWRVAVTAEGTATIAGLVQSSGSAAIDEAARTRIGNLVFRPATDRDGQAVDAETAVSLSYARWDNDSPGGGIEDYRCHDLVLEADWFAQAAAAAEARGETVRRFALENFYLTASSLALQAEGRVPPAGERERIRQQWQRNWQDIVQTCRRDPDSLLLDHIEERAVFALMVGGF